MNKYGVLVMSLLVCGSVSAADIFGGINKALSKVQGVVDSTKQTVDTTQATVDNANNMVNEAKVTADNAQNVGKTTAATNAPNGASQTQYRAPAQPVYQAPPVQQVQQAPPMPQAAAAPAAVGGATFKASCWNYNMSSAEPLNCNACEQQYQSQGMLARLNEFAAAGKKAQVDAFLADCPRAAR